MAHRSLWLALAVSLFAPGCHAGPPTGPSVVQSNLAGAPVSPTPRLRLVFSAAIDGPLDDMQAAVVPAPADQTVIAAFADGSPSARQRARLLAVRVTANERVLTVRPRRPLDPQHSYVLLVSGGLRIAGVRLGAPLLLPFATGGAELADPTVQLEAPLAGRDDVPSNLRELRGHFDRPVVGLGTLSLLGDDGAVAATRLQPGECEGCFALEMLEELKERTSYVLDASGVRDDDGRPVFGDGPGFATTGPIGPVAITAWETRTADGCLVVSWLTDGESDGELCQAGTCADTSGGRGHRAGVPVHDAGAGFSLRAWNETTQPTTELGPMPFPAPAAAPLAITALLVETAAARLGGQWIELTNRVSGPVDLAGLHVRDSAGFTELPAFVLAAGATVRIVPAQSTDETPGLLRLRERHLGGDGFDKGEAISLETASGDVLSRYGGWPLAGAIGQPIRRVAVDACDVPESFQLDGGS